MNWAAKASHNLGSNEAVDDEGGVGLYCPFHWPAGEVVNSSNNVHFIGYGSLKGWHWTNNIEGPLLKGFLGGNRDGRLGGS